jgi:hypothetical protein
MDAMHFWIVGLGGKVAQGCDNIPNHWSHGRLFLDTHCSDSQGLVQSPCGIPALKCWICHLGKLPPVFEQGSGLKLCTKNNYIDTDYKIQCESLPKPCHDPLFSIPIQHTTIMKANLGQTNHAKINEV